MRPRGGGRDISRVTTVFMTELGLKFMALSFKSNVKGRRRKGEKGREGIPVSVTNLLHAA